MHRSGPAARRRRPEPCRVDRRGAFSPQPVKDLYAWRQQAACFVVGTVADAIGPQRMRDVRSVISDGTDPWSTASAPVKRVVSILTWQDWLDIVTERGLIPAGADPDLAAKLLRRFGVAYDPAQLDAHAAARDAYHDMQDRTDGAVPAFITDAIRSWDFDPASAALSSMQAALSTADQVATILPAVEADGGRVEQAVLAATSQADLDAAVALAERQKTMAIDVLDAIGDLDEPRDSLQELGLSGSCCRTGPRPSRRSRRSMPTRRRPRSTRSARRSAARGMSARSVRR